MVIPNELLKRPDVIEPGYGKTKVTDEAMYRRLVESVSDYAIYMLDSDGYVSSWNPGAQRFKGYLADEIIGRHFSTFYPAEDRMAGRPETALKIARQRGRFEDKAWRVRKDGRRFMAHVVIDPVRDDHGIVIGYAKITRDISDSYAQEQELRESERRFRLLVSGVTDYAIYMLDLNGHISSWNAGAQRLKGYTQSEVLGRHFSVFYSDTDIADGRPARALQTALSTGRFEDTAWRIKKNGEPFWANVIIDLIHNESGEPVGFAKITRDISERRISDLRLKDLTRANEELEHFVQIASHDLREPLRKVLAFSDLLECDLDGLIDDTRRGYLKSISAATQRMQGLLDSLMQLTRVNAHGESFSLCELDDVLAEVLADMDIAIRDAAAIVEVGPLPRIEADPAQMRQLFQNLLENSLKYRNAAVPLRVDIRNLESHDATRVVIEVRDNGIGFEPKYAERIFGIFQRLHTRDQIPGSGVGLAVCRKICERHGGAITASGEPGVGATVVITLQGTYCAVRNSLDAT